MTTSAARRSAGKGAVWGADTVMDRVYVNALAVWTARHYADAEARITIPTGYVTAAELGKVLRGLVRAKIESKQN